MCPDTDPPPEFDAPVIIPITSELDLHAFRPGEIKSLLSDYFGECQERSISPVRVIHGKGTGTLREGVHRLLEKLPMVANWQWPAGAASGGWGATWVWLKPRPGSHVVNPTPDSAGDSVDEERLRRNTPPPPPI